MEEAVGKRMFGVKCLLCHSVPYLHVVTENRRLTLNLCNIACQKEGECSGNSLNLHSGVFGSFISRRTDPGDVFLIYLFYRTPSGFKSRTFSIKF
jgi:hypothetical protein